MVSSFLHASVRSILHTRYHRTPRYYRYDDFLYVRYDHNYYLYDDDREDYTILPEEEVPYDLYHSSAQYQIEDADFEDSGILDFKDSNSYNTSWSDSIDFFSDNDNDRDYSWNNNDNWDNGGMDWDDDW